MRRGDRYFSESQCGPSVAHHATGGEAHRLSQLIASGLMLSGSEKVGARASACQRHASTATVKVYPPRGISLPGSTQSLQKNALLSEGVTMHTGTISDFDADGLFGVIDSDDGRLILFNLRATDAASRGQFKIGTRVEFTEQCEEVAPRALTISPIVTAG